MMHFLTHASGLATPTLTLRNTGKQAVRVQVTATLHDTYHDNGQTTEAKRLNPGETGSFMIAAPDSKWIRRLDVKGGGSAELRLDGLAFAMSPRSQLMTVAGAMSGEKGAPGKE